MMHFAAFKTLSWIKNSYNPTVNNMSLKSIDLLIEDKFRLFCKYIIVSFFQ